MKIHKIHFGKQIIKFAIKRTKRKKTMAIFVSLPEGVRVNAPFKIKTKKVYFLVKRKAPWIARHLSEINEIDYPAIKHEFVTGESFSYLGRHYRLRVKKLKDTVRPDVVMNAGYLDSMVNSGLSKHKQMHAVRSALVEWYKKHAIAKLNERVSLYARKIEMPRPIVMVREQAKRWGSCSKDGVLRFNWRIIMAPMSVIDYVVAHELCHLKIKNHSPGFWRQVSLVIPDYEKRREWLRNNAGVFRL